jgi:hypothetical protein
MHNVLVLAQNRREENVKLKLLKMTLMMSRFVFNVMENINGT